jgi:hypothetical protein
MQSSPSSPRRSPEASVDQPPCGSTSESAPVANEQPSQAEDSGSEDVGLSATNFFYS